MRPRTVLTVIAIGLIGFSCKKPEVVNEYGLVVKTVGETLTPEQHREIQHALDGLEVAPGLEATLFAAEPMLANPTNIDIDARGRVWVCEGINYRPHLNPQNPVREEKERILILEDTDGDGVADSRKVFYEGTDINAAIGIAVFGNRVFVSVSPNVFVFTDEDGDDRADKKEVLFSGIKGVQHDHGVHAFTFGPDGRLYFNFGNAGEQLLDADGKPIVDASGEEVVGDGNPYRQGMVFRMNPDGSDFEVVGHNFRNNYEVVVDAFGTLWQSDNDDDGNRGTRINFVMEYGNYGFRDEMTGADWRQRRTGWEDEIPLRHWHLNDPGVVPNLLQTGAGSPTGMAMYEGRLLPEVFWDQMIHTDAGPNVVRSYPVKKSGAGYSAEIVNILKGTHDQWFRPSDVAVAPDGSLIVADWYDPGVGGHHVGDLEKGRLYRIAPPGSRYAVPKVDLITPESAVIALKSPNVATRYLAWNALHDMGAAAEPALTRMLDDPNPRMQARALWLLGQIDNQGSATVERALADENEDIRIAGLRLARQLDLDLIPYIRQLADDPSAQIRREAAIALRHNTSPEAPALWARLASHHDGADRWYLEALGIAADRQWDAFFGAWREQNLENWDTPAGRDIVWRSRAEAALPMLSELILSPKTSDTERLRYFRALDFHPDSPAKSGLLTGLLAANHADQLGIRVLALQHLAGDDALKQPATRKAIYATLDEVRGTRAFLDMVDRFKLADQGETLFAMALDNPGEELGKDAGRILIDLGGRERILSAIATADAERASAIIAMLGGVGSGGSRGTLEAIFMDKKLPLDVRRRALERFGPGWQGENRMLALLEAGTFPEELNATASSILFASNDSRRRVGAEKYFTPPAGTGGEPLPAIDELVDLQGDAAAGADVFATMCSTCHVVHGEGVDFGPGLSEIGDKLTPEALYTAILFPDAGIGFGYEGYVLKLKDGSEAAGYILNQSGDEIRLREVGGRTNSYSVTDVASKEAMGQSLMPALGRTLSREQLVNLVAYLGTLKAMGESD
ncbi:MAG: c-type cytochrome [Rhodothermales bacterium]